MIDRLPSVSLVSKEELETWRAAIGREEIRREFIAPEPLRRFALAIGADPAVEEHQPPLAHWAYFLPQAEDGSTGPDGHPRRGGFLPDVSLPRRMFASSRIEFNRALTLSVEAVQTSRVVDVEHKSGRSGDLVFVEVERTIAQDQTIRVRERQTFVYRGNGPAIGMPMPSKDPPDGEAWQPTEMNLFRFSAATFNAHRIHYDAPYARAVEGYPGLVVHGPFTATRLAALAGRGGSLSRFSFRANAPLFIGQPIYLQSTGGNAVVAIRCDGVVAMRAEFARSVKNPD